MSIETLKDGLPDYAKDLKLNLSSLLTETALTEQQRAGTFVASALASRNPTLIAAILARVRRRCFRRRRSPPPRPRQRSWR